MKLSLLMLCLNAILLVAWVCVALLFTVKFSAVNFDNAAIEAARNEVIKMNPPSPMYAESTSSDRDLTVGSTTSSSSEVELSTSSTTTSTTSTSSEPVPSDLTVTTTSTTSSQPIPSDLTDFTTNANKEDVSPLSAGQYDSSSSQGMSQSEWAKNVCGTIKDTVCHEVFLVKSKQATFCSAAKVASTTTKQYFYDISDGELEIPEGARFGVHEANWKKFGDISQESREWVLGNEEWTHVFFWKHVLERFVSGYLDKVVTDCKKDPTDKPHLVINHYVQYGFSCEKHVDLEAFVNFIETVPHVEGHFAPQTPLCNLNRFPYTDIIRADENLNLRLENISTKLGVPHPEENKKTSKHRTGAKEKLVAIFKDKPFLIEKILKLFKEDCERLPEACDVDDIMAAIKEETSA